MRYAIPLIFAAGLAQADPPQITDVSMQKSGASWRFSVTLEHPDTGWDHYADGWRVLGPDGTEIGYRKLLHPHVNEQPFTRSLSGIDIPEGATHLTIVPHDSVHGAGPAYRLELN